MNIFITNKKFQNKDKSINNNIYVLSFKKRTDDTSNHIADISNNVFNDLLILFKDNDIYIDILATNSFFMIYSTYNLPYYYFEKDKIKYIKNRIIMYDILDNEYNFIHIDFLLKIHHIYGFNIILYDLITNLFPYNNINIKSIIPYDLNINNRLFKIQEYSVVKQKDNIFILLHITVSKTILFDNYLDGEFNTLETIMIVLKSNKKCNCKHKHNDLEYYETHKNDFTEVFVNTKFFDINKTKSNITSLFGKYTTVNLDFGLLYAMYNNSYIRFHIDLYSSNNTIKSHIINYIPNIFSLILISVIKNWYRYHGQKVNNIQQSTRYHREIFDFNTSVNEPITPHQSMDNIKKNELLNVLISKNELITNEYLKLYNIYNTSLLIKRMRFIVNLHNLRNIIVNDLQLLFLEENKVNNIRNHLQKLTDCTDVTISMDDYQVHTYKTKCLNVSIYISLNRHGYINKWINIHNFKIKLLDKFEYVFDDFQRWFVSNNIPLDNILIYNGCIFLNIYCLRLINKINNNKFIKSSMNYFISK